MANKDLPIYTCCLCGAKFQGYGNNPEPVMPMYDENGNENRCCDLCNADTVIPTRILRLYRK